MLIKVKLNPVGQILTKRHLDSTGQKYFSQKCAEKVTVANGQFAADMQVTLTNDGPVTFWLNV